MLNAGATYGGIKLYAVDILAVYIVNSSFEGNTEY